MAKGIKTGGRQKGTPNKDISEVKAAISMFVTANAEEIQSLWKTLAMNDPGKALQIYFSASEYVLPRLARTENTTELKGSLPSINVNLTKPNGND